MTAETIWLVIGFAGQAFFTARFFVQWLASEKVRRSIIPPAFWVFSILGGATLLTYAIYRQDPVFIVGQATGLFIYARNVYFVMVESKANKAAAQDAGNP